MKDRMLRVAAISALIVRPVGPACKVASEPLQKLLCTTLCSRSATTCRQCFC